MDESADVFTEESYKITLKQRMKDLRELRPGLTWRKLASEIPLQYTYLSKALNDEHTHLSEDHLFVLCRAMQFFPEESEYIQLQRSHATARDPERKNHLYRRLREIQRAQKVTTDVPPASSQGLHDQIQYLFEPLCLVVHMAMFLPQYREDPRRLCGPLGIQFEQLKEILRTLSRNGYIDLSEDGLHIRKVEDVKLHFGPDHFLMRYHLSMVKSQMIARVARTPESDKYGFAATFVMDDESFLKVREEFKTFLKRVEHIAQNTKDEHVYQLSFDLFKWL